MPINQLNLPAIYGAAQQYKTQQAQNQMAGMEMESKQRFNALAPDIAGGDYEAYQSGLSEDPQGAQDLWGAYNKEDNARRTQVARLARYVLSQPEQSRPQAWQQVLAEASKIPGMDVSQMPQEYDEQMVQMILARSTDPQAIKGQSPIGKSAADVRSRLVTDEQHAAVVAKANAPAKSLVEVNVGQSGIDYGNPPKGHAWARGKDGKVMTRTDSESGYESPIAVPVAGGPVETKRTTEAAQAGAKQRQKKTVANIVMQDIDRSISMIESADIPVTGLGSLLSDIPGTTARDVSALIDTIRANVGFDTLQTMRDNSPTGGALGQVSELENRLMQATKGNLELSQGKDQLLFNLHRIRKLYDAIINGVQDESGNLIDPNTDPAKWQEKVLGDSNTGQSEETKTLNGKTYIKKDGKWYEQ